MLYLGAIILEIQTFQKLRLYSLSTHYVKEYVLTLTQSNDKWIFKYFLEYLGIN